MANKFSSFLNKNSLEYNIHKSEEHLASQLDKGVNEAVFTSRYLKTAVAHLKNIIDNNPDLTNDEINTILFSEIDDYAKTVYENAYVFGEYLEYLCCQYFADHSDKYKEISEKLLTSNLDFSNIHYSDCRNFDEYLLLYTYTKKRDLFNQIFEDFESTIPSTPKNHKRFDELLQDNLRLTSKNYFDKYFSLPMFSDTISSDDSLNKKKAKIREYATWYRNPRDRKDFELYANIFLYGSYQYVLSDQEYISQNMRKDLARSTSRLVEQLDKLGHLDTYMTDFVFEMSRMEYPEFAGAICNNGFPTQEFVNDIVKISKDLSALEASKNMAPDSEKENISLKIASLKRAINRKKSEIVPYLNKDKLKSSLGENLLNSSKTLSLESLLALNSFWANRYVKELDLYANIMYAVHKFDLIDKVRNGQSTYISENDLQNMLVQKDTFYSQANIFLSEQQNKVNKSNRDDEEEYEDGDVEEKIHRFSYDPFIKSITRNFGVKEYSSYFSQILPGLTHNVKDDADWYIRLYNPIFSSYLMKDEMLNVLLLSIGNSNSENFPNAGIILENYQATSTESPDRTSAYIPYFPVIGIDAGLSFPVRIHIQKNMLIDFLKSFNGNAMLPIYEGASDFHHPYKNNSPIAASLIMPITDKLKALFKKGLNKNEFAPQTSQDYHPHARFVSHLAFNSTKKVPFHLQNNSSKSKGKSKNNFVRRYINLESGYIYHKVNDEYVKVEPSPISKFGQGDDEHGI